MSPDDPVFDEIEEVDDDLDDLEEESVYCTCGHLNEDHLDFENECCECECESFKPQEVD